MKLLDYLTLYFDGEGDGTNGGADNNGASDKGAAGAKDNTNKTGNNNNGNNGSTDNGDDRDAPKYSDADLDKIIEKKLAKWKKQQAAAVDEATRLASMTAQERAEHERDKLQKELDELKRANTIAEMEKTARGILTTDGVTVSDRIVATLVDEDAEETSANVKAFIEDFKKAVQDGVKRQLTHKAPAGGNGAGTITKADIMKESDPKKRQQLIRDNMALFKH